MAGKKPSDRFTDGFKIGTNSDPTRVIHKDDKFLIQDSSEATADNQVRAGVAGDLIGDILGAAIVVKDNQNLRLAAAITAGYYISKTTGDPVVGASYSYTDYIDITDKDGIYLTAAISQGGAFYNAAGAFVAGITGSGAVYLPRPVGATQMRVSYQTSAPTIIQTYVNYRKPAFLQFEEANLDGIGEIYSDMTSLLDLAATVPPNLPTYLGGCTWTDGKYLNSGTGAEGTSGSYKYSALIDITGARKLLFYASVAHTCCFFTEGEVFIIGAGSYASAGIQLTDGLLREVDVPLNAKYVRVNLHSAYWTDPIFYVKKNSATYKKLSWLMVPKAQVENPFNHWAGKKIVWLGTSIPAGGYSNNISYPSMICDKLQATLVNTSLNGQALHHIAGGFGGKSGVSSLTEAETIAIMPAWEDGGNPGHLAAAYQYRSYENSLLGHNADLYVFDTESNNTETATTAWDAFNFTTWVHSTGDFADHRESYMGAMLFLLNALWTENPLARVVFIGWQGNASATIRARTLTMATQLNIPYIDLWKKMQYNVPINKALLTAAGDGIHPNLTWARLMADALTNELLLVR